MKRLLLAYLLPLCIALGCIYYTATSLVINKVVFKPNVNKAGAQGSVVFIDNFINFPRFEDNFLLSGDSSDIIYLFGSSELTGSNEAWPFHFISDRFTTKLKGIGHAGSQSFSIYAQLMANQERLKNCPIVIMVSPTWFYSKEANGTTSAIFLEFNSENFINKVNQSPDSEFKTYYANRVAGFFNEINSPGIALKQTYYNYQSAKSVFHKPFYQTFIAADQVIGKLSQKIKNEPTHQSISIDLARKPIVQDSILINWDSILPASKKQVLSIVTNNNWGVNDEYYNKYVNGNRSKVRMVQFSENQEFRDFQMVLKLLKYHQAKASFVICPMNPYFYEGCSELKPLISLIEKEIISNNYPCKNMWVADTTNYEKGILRDVMHLSQYGWHNIDRFIIDTYKLNK